MAVADGAPLMPLKEWVAAQAAAQVATQRHRGVAYQRKEKTVETVWVVAYNPEAVVEVLTQGAAGSWQMVNRHKTMLKDQFDFGFAVDWMRKDLAICLQTADEIGARLPVTALVDQFYKDVQLMGGGRNDTSSLIRRLK